MLYLEYIPECAARSKSKKINPHQIIVLGGPEVSFDSVELMKEHPYIDYIVFGEGEETFREL